MEKLIQATLISISTHQQMVVSFYVDDDPKSRFIFCLKKKKSASKIFFVLLHFFYGAVHIFRRCRLLYRQKVEPDTF